MKFLLDENINRGLAPFLLGLKQDIKFVEKGFKNGEVFELAISEDRILITHDEEFADWIKFPPERHRRILLIKISPKNLEEIKRTLSKFLEGKTSEDFKNKLFIIFPDRIEKLY